MHLRTMHLRTVRLGTCLSLILLPPTFAAAESVRQIVPYSGHLDFDGQPFNGTAQMRFRLYTAADTPVAEDCAAEPACAWEEAKDTVRGYNGAFAVRLGESDPEAMAALVSQDTQYWLEMAVRNLPAEGEEPAPWISLTGRQAITPAPQALWTASATDLSLDSLRVAGPASVDSLDVVRGATVGGALTAQGALTTVGLARFGNQLHLDASATATGDIPFRGAPADNVGLLAIGDKDRFNLRFAQNEIIALDNGAATSLYLNYNRDSAGQVIVGSGGLRVDGPVHLRGLRYVGGSAGGAAFQASVGQDQTRTTDTGVSAVDHICMITYQRFEGLDGGDDRAACALDRSAGNTWTIAASTAGGASSALCVATCIDFGQ